MSVSHVTEPSKFKTLTDTGLAVVKYTARWCGPCKRVEPVYKELAKTNTDIQFVHVDIDDAEKSLPNQLQAISSVPTFHFYKNGAVVDSLNGANADTLRSKVKKLKESAATAVAAIDAKTSAAAADANSSAVVSVNKCAQYAELVASGKAVVDFAAEWCMPCQLVKPLFAELAGEHGAAVKFLRVDIDEAAEELESLMAEIRSVPTFLFYAGGKIVDRMSGANPTLLKQKINALSKGTFDAATATVPAAAASIEKPKETEPAKAAEATVSKSDEAVKTNELAKEEVAIKADEHVVAEEPALKEEQVKAVEANMPEDTADTASEPVVADVVDEAAVAEKTQSDTSETKIEVDATSVAVEVVENKVETVTASQTEDLSAAAAATLEKVKSDQKKETGEE